MKYKVEKSPYVSMTKSVGRTDVTSINPEEVKYDGIEIKI